MYIAVTVILHNLLIGFGDKAAVCDDDVSEIDEENELNRPIREVRGNLAASRRREQLKKYIMENYHV